MTKEHSLARVMPARNMQRE